MAVNPKDWSGATPFDFEGSLDKSGMSHWDSPTPNGETSRKSKATPFSHSGSVGKSGGANLGNPYARKSDRTAAKPLAHGNGSMAPATPHSGPEPKATVPPRSWKRKNYSMQTPSTAGGGHMRKGRRDIS